ncbi:hypothetical protein [Streptomyces chartreusis]|uniref:hypothetical protein n=1 Tax=Streptomyces chartreusis TaxID=1969 RepID=UPI00123C879C|nr:hypothetical protein [Streptomyces chartreusis]
MDYLDKVLRDMQENVEVGDPPGGPYQLGVVVGGVRFKGRVVPADRFAESLPPPGELTSTTPGFGHFLHLRAMEGPGISSGTPRVVRFRLDSIDAWWAE